MAEHSIRNIRFGIGDEAYSSWDEAAASSSGYDSRLISDLALAGALAVKRGDAVFERDTVLFHSPAHRWQLLACISAVAASNAGRVHVLDVGGSFASVYLQHLSFFKNYLGLRWSVVEQPHIVALGREHLQDERLYFFSTVEEANAVSAADLIVFSGSFQFMVEPYAMLERAARTRCTHIVIDRITLSPGPEDRITVFRVDPSIYPGSYPQWVLSERKVLGHLSDNLGFFETARYVDGIDGGDHVGLLFERRGGVSCTSGNARRFAIRPMLERLRRLVRPG
ncbi:methyltransferase, TIGR04325 family [Methylobacterium sp. J-030]|uniref:methyltransferase, TIGR04325 family n=1 Tax=Methylobacterium sp. J-030 TaxID=2836627 RepID=UPI001FB8C047|nr:methyltransferase, TIGR04325 family [Methylobacterium sp. J-030]MCJ2067814.1 methyltransferase, TIGR04325 family [Methylobacterium sp. J-030]